MNVLGRMVHTLRSWLGLAAPSESRLIPEHGWLQLSPADARKHRTDADARRAARHKKAQA
jgi:hypothetical protein